MKRRRIALVLVSGVLALLVALALTLRFDDRASTELGVGATQEPRVAAPPSLALRGTRPATEEAVGHEHVAAGVERPSPTGAEVRVVTVRVLDARLHSPVAGARILVAAGDEAMAKFVGTSDREGAFSTPYFGREDLTYLFVHAQGYRLRAVQVADVLSDGKVLLERGAVIAGRVQDFDGRPIAGARVAAFRYPTPAGWPHEDEAVLADGWIDGSVTHSEPDGKFVLEGLEAGVEYFLHARAPGRFTYHPKNERRHLLPSARGGDVEVVLWMGRAITLTLEPVDAATGNAIASPYVALVQPPNGFQDFEFAPRRTVADAWRQDSGTRWSLTWVATPEAAGDSPWIDVSWRAFGFAPYRGRVDVSASLASTEAIAYPIHLRRLPGYESGSVVVHAQMKSGEPFHGRLGLKLVPVHTRTPAPAGSRFIDIGADKAPPKLELPAGAYRLTAMGWGASGHWWHPLAEALELRVAAHGEQDLNLTLHGTPVELDVRDANGRVLAAFDLRIERDGKWSDAYGNWGLQAEQGSRGRILWLLPGIYRLQTTDGWGRRGSSSIEVDDSGRPQAVRILMRK